MTRPRLNGPMVARLRACAADRSPNWDGQITIYPPEAKQLVALIDAVRGINRCARGLDPSEVETVFRAQGCGMCGRDHLAELPTLLADEPKGAE